MTATDTESISTIPVKTPTNVYDIHVGHDLLGLIGRLVSPLNLGRKVVIATDTNVEALYGNLMVSALRIAGYEAHVVAMPAGEEHKVWGSVALFIDGFIAAGLDRTGWVLALGGGVVGDTAGFAAATYMRGVRLVQAPTTLLSMADSSVGGKVGVDHPSGKNLMGVFKQPDLVIADLDMLTTLPSLQLTCGMAEIIKAGIIADPDLFNLIEQASPGQLDYREALLRAIAVKRDIVEDDPYETTVKRALLNLGHTFGHALESCTNYARPHGVAVAQGIALAFDLATNQGLCAPSVAERVQSVFASWELPTRWGSPTLEDAGAPERVYAAMLLDKKRRDGHLRLILPKSIGDVAIVEDVPREIILERLVALQ
jgi:3-dehydroquinate synthase